MLVIVLEARMFEFSAHLSDEGPWFDRAFNVAIALSILGFVVLGEFSALRALASGRAENGDAPWVYSAPGAGFAAVVLIGIGAPFRPRPSDNSR